MFLPTMKRLFKQRRLFGGLALMAWREPQERTKLRDILSQLMLSISFWIVVAACSIAFPALTRSQFDISSFVTMLIPLVTCGAIIGLIIGIFSALIKGFSGTTVTIKRNQIMCSSIFGKMHYWYKDYDFFDITKFEKEASVIADSNAPNVDDYLVLVNEETGSVAFGIAPSVNQKILAAILSERLPHASAFSAKHLIHSRP